MNRFVIYYCILTIISGSCFASNEINAFAPGVTTAYSVIRNGSGQVWYVSGQAFEAWGTDGRTAADYDIALTNKSGGMFVGDFDTNVSAGKYYISSHYQSGGTPVDTDPIVWVENGYWDGDEWLNGTVQDVNELIADVPTAAENADAVWDELSTGHTDAGKAGQQLWMDIDAINEVTSILQIIDTMVSASNDANSFTLTAGADVNNAYTGNTIYVQDADDGEWESRMIIDWTDARVVTVDEPFGFTPAVADRAVIWSFYLSPYIYYNLPKRTMPAPIPVDYRVQAGGGTRTLDVFGDDP